MARITLSTHWKFQRLARALGSKVLARGVLETLWEPCWMVGDAYIGTAQDIEALCEWKGERGVLTKALLMPDAKNAGFIEPYEGNIRNKGENHYQIHDFLHHCPEYVRQRREREMSLTQAKVCVFCKEEYFARSEKSRYCSHKCRQKAYRIAGLDDTGRVTDVTVGDDSVTVRDDSPQIHRHKIVTENTPDVTVNRHVSPDGPNTGDREVGANREISGAALRSVTIGDDSLQYSRSHSHTHTQHPGNTNSSAARMARAKLASDPPGLEVEDDPPPKRKRQHPPPDTSAIVLTFPVIGEPGPWWHLRETQVARWRELYPHVDILSEARQALAWIEADVHRRKTWVGMRKCLVSWLNRSVDRQQHRGGGVITGSLKTAGNKAAMEEILRRRGHVVD